MRKLTPVHYEIIVKYRLISIQVEKVELSLFVFFLFNLLFSYTIVLFYVLCMNVHIQSYMFESGTNVSLFSEWMRTKIGYLLPTYEK